MFFYINPQKTKVDQNCNIDLLKISLLHKCRRHCLGNDFEFLQDSVPSHREKVTLQGKLSYNDKLYMQMLWQISNCLAGPTKL